MSFPKSTKAYGRKLNDKASLGRYERAKREWDDRIGSARVQAFHWRLTALTAIAGMLGLGISLVYLSLRREVKTYVVEIDQLGKPARISLTGDHYQPNSAQSAYFTGQLVKLVRARPLDPVVVRDNWKMAYGFLAGDAIQTMNAYATSDPPLQSVDGRPFTRAVAITNVLQKSSDTYQVRWVETDYVGGVPQTPQQYTGLFQTQVKPPRNEVDVFRNPLGIYIVSFSWSQEFTKPVTLEADPATQPSPTADQESNDDPSQN